MQLTFLLILALIFVSNSAGRGSRSSDGDDDQPWRSRGQNRKRVFDVLIVGGGVSGLYLDWNLDKLVPDLNVGVLEKLDRLGGRMFTSYATYEQNTVQIENGAMRFPLIHKSVLKLITRLGLCPQVTPFNARRGNNTYYVRGTRIPRLHSDPTVWSKIFNLAPNEIGETPSTLLQQAFASLFSDPGNIGKPFPTSNPADLQRFRAEFTYRGRPVFDWGWWEFIRAQGWSDEAYQMVRTAFARLDVFDDDFNLGGIQEFGVSGAGTKYTLQNGYGQVISRMFHDMRPSTRRKVLLQTKVIGIRVWRRYKQKLYRVLTQNTQTGQRGFLLAKKVVLALPKVAIEEIICGTPILQTPSVKYLVNSVTGHSALKVTLVYGNNDRWWDTQLGLNGGSISDTELGAIEVVDAWIDGNLSVVQIYTDGYRVKQWAQIQKTKPLFQKQGVVSSVFPNGQSNLASANLVQFAKQSLDRMFGIETPEPLAAYFANWGKESDLGAAWHLWAVGYNDSEVTDRVWKPSAKHDIFVVGEAYSLVHSWAEGALLTVNSLVKEVWGVDNVLANEPVC